MVESKQKSFLCTLFKVQPVEPQRDYLISMAILFLIKPEGNLSLAAGGSCKISSLKVRSISGNAEGLSLPLTDPVAFQSDHREPLLLSPRLSGCPPAAVFCTGLLMEASLAEQVNQWPDIQCSSCGFT